VPEAGPLREEFTRDGRALLIRPDERRGLTPADLDEIEAFCRKETRKDTREEPAHKKSAREEPAREEPAREDPREKPVRERADREGPVP
jgi:hypothetical protein